MFPLGRRNIGRYELLIPLASGGMATVYLGRFFGLAGFEKLVAVKVIHPHLAMQKEFVEMFLDEARLSARIHHPNVIEVFEVGEDDGLFFMGVELVSGQSLNELITAASRAHEPLEPRLYLSIVAKVCDALQAAHILTATDGSPLHLVHRDISPSNILISYNGFIKLIDFGIAFAKGRLATTRSGVVKGKCGYLAPEQLRNDPVDRRMDLFSLGVVLYDLATGRHPFPGDSEAEQINRLLNDEPPSPRLINPKIEPALERTIIKALAKDPGRRHQSAEELGLELRKLLLPLGGFVDNADLANLMGRYFSQQIIDDRQKIERATATPPELEANSNKGESVKLDRPGQHQAPLKAKNEVSALPNTEMLDHVFVPKESHWRQRVLILAIMGAVAGTLGFVWVRSIQQTGPDPLVIRPSMSPSSATAADLPETVPPSPSVPDATPPSTAPPQPSDFPPDATLAVKAVELHLVGLPEASWVLLDDNETATFKGRILVPGDGKQRTLKILAKGYLPYQNTIALKKDGQLTVRLVKKRASLPKSKTYRTMGKGSRDTTLAECPYCD